MSHFETFFLCFLILFALKFLFSIIFGDLSKNFGIIAERHNQIKNKIFALTSGSNLNFARTGVFMRIPESHEDQLNNLNKISILKQDKDVKEIGNQDVINDDYFRKQNMTKKDYHRMIELVVEAHLKTDGKLSKQDLQNEINKL